MKASRYFSPWLVLRTNELVGCQYFWNFLEANPNLYFITHDISGNSQHCMDHCILKWLITSHIKIGAWPSGGHIQRKRKKMEASRYFFSPSLALRHLQINAVGSPVLLELSWRLFEAVLKVLTTCVAGCRKTKIELYYWCVHLISPYIVW